MLCARCQAHSSGAQWNSLLLPTSAAPPYVFASPLCFQASSLGSRSHGFPITLQGPAAIFQLYARQAQTWPFCSKADTQPATEKEYTPNLAQPLGGDSDSYQLLLCGQDAP